MHFRSNARNKTWPRDSEESDRTCIIETHSPELVKEFLKKIGSGDLRADDFYLYKTAREDGRTVVSPIDVEAYPDGVDVYENWERGISV